ncbi:MAG TPA: hypothetical protein VGM77_11255 [Gemmatimonadales bacterium]|jgi:hypothetical protein
MSVMFLKQLKLHREALGKKMSQKGGANHDQELAQTRQFLSATKDPKWKNQLIKRIKVLENNGGSPDDVKDIEARYKAVDALYQSVQNHPDYNKTRKKRTPRK